MPQTEKKAKGPPQLAELEKRAAARNYTIEKDGKQWYAVIGGTRYGPMGTLEELDEFLPNE